eukprot:92169-Pleurochrysis_carterae.AAC.1
MPAATGNRTLRSILHWIFFCIFASFAVCTAFDAVAHAPHNSTGVNATCAEGRCSFIGAKAKKQRSNVTVYNKKKHKKGLTPGGLVESRLFAKRALNHTVQMTCNIKPLTCISFPMLCARKDKVTGELVSLIQAALLTPCTTLAWPVTVLLLILIGISRCTLSSQQDSNNGDGASADEGADNLEQVTTLFRAPPQNRIVAFAREVFDSVTVCWHTAPPILLQHMQYAYFALLMIQLHALAIPEGYAFMLPEMIEYEGILARGTSFWTEYLLPGVKRHDFSPISITSQLWREQLNLERWGVIIFISIYLMLPPLPRQRWMRTLSAASFTAGTLLLTHMTGIAAMLLKSHTNAPLFQMLVGALIAMPSMQLATTPAGRMRAGSWLCNCYFFCIVVPTYLCSGLSKVRYEGFLALLDSSYTYNQFEKAANREHAPLRGFNHDLITSLPSSMYLLGWFIVLFELVLPSIVLVARQNSNLAKWARLALMIIAAKFHVVAFFLFGANFCFNLLLLLLLLAAMSPTWIPLAHLLARDLARKLLPETFDV